MTGPMKGTTHYVSPAIASWRGAEEADGHGSIASGTGDGPCSVAVADLNTDAAPDLVTANGHSDDVSLLLHRPPTAVGGTVNLRSDRSGETVTP
ncbi:MAG: hypothetical protein JSU97_10135 [Dehalococcoidia bacterium]|nr:MAG: hypothetical protein JSU97_10135 [Dehalococcoidia bacterium]